MADQFRQGPATFAIDTDAAVGSQGVPQIGAPTAQPGNVAPGLSTQAPGANDADARTMRAIIDLASGALAPKVKEAAQAQYIKGVQEAMTGKSLEEIQADKPWYTDIFAPSAALAGARTYTAQRAVAEWAGKMQADMPKLAQVGPEALQAAATGALQGFLTGDASADALITGAVTEQMAPLFKQHAKEHYIHVQKQASEAQIGSWEALGRVYQGVAASAASGKGTVSPEDLDAAKARFLASVSPFADQSDEAFERNISAFLEGSATAGNGHVIRLFKDTGLYDKISPDKRAQLDRALKVAGRETLTKAMPEFAMDIAKLTTDMHQDPAGIPDRVAAINARAAAMTGVTEADLIPLSSLDNLMAHVMTAQEREAAQARRAQMSAAEKLAEEAAEVAAAAAQIQVGGGAIDRWVLLGEGKEAAAEKAGLALYMQAKEPAARAAVLNSRTLKPFDGVKSIYASKLRSEEFTPGIGAVSQEYAAMAENVKPLYFNEHERRLMDRFNMMVRTDMQAKDAWVLARNSTGDSRIPEGTKDGVLKLIRSEVESQNETWYGRNTVTDAGLAVIEAAVAQTYKLDRANVPDDVAVKRGYAHAKTRGLDVVGRHPMLKTRPTDPPLHLVVGEGARDTAEALDAVMTEKAKGIGASLDAYEVFRLPDAGKQARLRVVAYDDEGKVRSWDITSAELKASVTTRVRKEKAPAATLPDMWEDPQALIEQAR